MLYRSLPMSQGGKTSGGRTAGAMGPIRWRWGWKDEKPVSMSVMPSASGDEAEQSFEKRSWEGGPTAAARGMGRCQSFYHCSKRVLLGPFAGAGWLACEQKIDQGRTRG
jgi:hypothetical protein